MSIMTTPSAEARISLSFITGGTLLAVWSAIWYVYLRNHPPENSGTYYICAGLFLSGVVLVTIGVAVGHIGRAARRAEIPPPEVTAAIVGVNQEAASRAPIVAPINPAQPVVPAGANAATAATPVVPSNVVVNPQNGPVRR